jgi:hypothetical protein
LQKFAGKAFYNCKNSGGASPPHAPATGKTGGSGMSSSSLSPYAGSDLHRQQNHNNQLILVFISFFFKSASVFFFFRSVPFLCLHPSLFVYLLPMVDQMVAVVRGSKSW